MVESTKYLARNRFQLEEEAALRRMTPGTSGTKVSTWVIEQALALADGGSIFDLACGNGRHLPSLMADNTQVYAGDISDAMLRVACSHLGNAPEATRLIRLDAEKLPFPDHTFDVVLSIRFFHHLPTQSLRASILSEAFRVSRRAVIITYKAFFSWEHLMRRVKSLLRGQRGHLEHYYLSARKIEEIARLGGWRITGHFASQPFLGANRVLVMEPFQARTTATIRATSQKTTPLPPLEPVIG